MSLDDESFHIAGDIRATTAESVGKALPRIPDGRIEVSSEVAFEGDNFDLAIYPDQPAGAGGYNFLVSGNAWMSEGDVHAWLKQIADAFDREGIIYHFELQHERHPTEVFEHPQFRNSAAEVPSPTPTVEAVVHSPASWSVDGGRIVLGDRLYSGSTDEVRIGWIPDAPFKRFLVTLTGRHSESFESLRLRLALPFEGIAPLESIAAVDPGTPYDDALVERLPAGETLRPPLAEAALARIGAEVATILARVHAAGAIVDGIRPELIYSDRRVTTLVPRGPAFIATAPLTKGIRTYHVPYFSPEQFLSRQSSAASDVFALCATLYFLGTGRHPFGDPEALAALASRLATGAPEPWAGSRSLGELLEHGLSREPSARPDAKTLAAELAQLAAA